MFKLTFRQQVVLGFALTLLFVLIASYTALNSIQSLKDDADWENHTYEVIYHAKNLEFKILNTENDLRGYVLTRHSEHLDSYKNNISEIAPLINDLQRLTADNSAQAQILDSLEFYSEQKTRNMQVISNATDTKGDDTEIFKILTEKGRTFNENMFRLNK